FTSAQTCRDAVEALASSVLEATLVDRLKLGSPTLARPDPPSEAEHATSTSCWCQNPSADPQLTTGALRSTLKVYGPAVALFPMASVNAWLPVEALALSVPSATVVAREADVAPDMPEPPSVAAQLTDWLSPYQTLGLGAVQVTLGAFLSILFPLMFAGDAAQLLTASHAWVPPADAAAFEVSVPLATLVGRLTVW